MKAILLIMIGLSTFSMAIELPRYTKTDGIVSDSKTGLAWQDDYVDNEGSVKKATWTDALAYCDGLRLGGNDDWRLPNFNELYSIGDKSRSDPAIDPEFTNVIFKDYWSSTTYASKDSKAWVVYFNDGRDASKTKSKSGYVRCVRDDSRFLIFVGSVTPNINGLHD